MEAVTPRHRFRAPLLILVAAALATAPVALHGSCCGDDFQFHLVSWLDAQQSWRHGIPYPHWTPSPNYGAGEPRFVFYPPLTWMLGAALGFVLPWAWVPVAMIFVLLSATGLATFALARRMIDEAPATLAAVATVFSVYVLFTAYERAAFAELAGGFWIPLLLLFALRERTPSRGALDRSALLLALVIAGSWLSNAPVGVMASYLLAAVAVASAVMARSWLPIVRASIACGLGMALAAIYLVPATYEQRWVDIAEATGASGEPGLRIENNWLFGSSTNPALKLHNAELRSVSQWITAMIAVALVSAIVVWMRRRTSLRRPEWIILACIPIAVLFLQLPVSLPVWNLLPKLRFLQFPWRWLLVLEAPMGILLVAAIWPRDSARNGQRFVSLVLGCTILLGPLLFAKKYFFRICDPDANLPKLLAAHRSGAGFWGAYEYAPLGADNSFVATGLPDACLTSDPYRRLGVVDTSDHNPEWSAAQGSCDAVASADLRTPEHLHIATVNSNSGFAILRLRTFPAWRIDVNGQEATHLPQRNDGLMVVPIPQGAVAITTDWTTTSDVIVGRTITLIAVLLLGLLWHRESKSRYHA